MDRDKDGHQDGPSTAQWLSIVALALGALWDAWNVATLVERGGTPEIPFVSAVLMTAVAVVAWRRWPG